MRRDGIQTTSSTHSCQGDNEEWGEERQHEKTARY